MMLRSLLFAAVVFASAALAPTVARAAIELDPDRAPIEGVVVYRDRAQVDRAARVSVSAGRTEVTVGGLPTPLLPGSVRARVDGDVVRVIGLTQREEVHIEQRRAEVRELLEQVRERRAAFRELQIEDASLQARLEQIRQLRDYSRGTLSLQQTDPGFDPSSFDRSLDLFRDDSVAVMARRSELQAGMRDVEDDLATLQRRINDLQYGVERVTTTVTVTLEATAASTAELTVSYGVGGVSWAPRYDIRYDDGALRLDYLAQVRQASGEDWDDVRLVFTTARPDEMVPPPANQPLYLEGYKEKETTVQLGSAREEVDDGDDDLAPTGGEEIDGRGGARVGITRRSLAVDLEVTEAATVPADGRPYRITILEQPLEATVDRYAAPALSPHVYLRARTRNQTGIPLLAGPADVFRSSGYVGTIHLDELAPGEELALSLGPAGPVLVEREFDAERNRTVEHAAGRKKVHFVYDLVAHNHDEQPTELVIAEAVPVSRVQQVRIAVDEETTTSGFELDEDGSVHSWTLALQAGEERRLHLEYVVDLPEDYAWEGF